MVIQHNLMAMNAGRQFGIVNKKKTKSMEKLSSGYKINRAADDAAGLAMSEKMRRQIRGLTQASENCQDGVSFNQIADGAMNEVSDMLLRMEELSVKAANGTLTDVDRSYIQVELEKLKDEIDHISDETIFNELPVFGKEMQKTVYTVDRTISKQESFFVEGNQYGLALVLNSDGGNHIYEGKKLQNPLTLDSLDTVTSGGVKYSGSAYSAARSIVQASQGAFTREDITRWIDNQDNVNGNAPDHIVREMEDGTRYELTLTDDTKYYVPQTIDETGNLQNAYWLKGSIKLQKDGVDVGIYKLNFDTEGRTGFVDGKQYGSAWIDFSGLGTTYNAESLYGLGFNTSCASCSRYYSILFTDDSIGADYEFSGSRWSNPVVKVNVSGCGSGADLVQKIMKAVNVFEGGTTSNRMSDHYQQYAYNTYEPAKLYIYDNRTYYYPGGGSSSFEPIARDEAGQMMTKEVTVYTPTEEVITYRDLDIWIQAGAESHSGFYIKRAVIDTAYLGINGIDVSTQEDAGEALTHINHAIEFVNGQRAMVGAQQNRCENAVKVDDNSVENTTAAESRIRDTDMAQEMVALSIHNILAQAGENMLAQANQTSQGVMNLLQ